MPRATATFLENLKKSGEPFAVHTIIHQNADPQNYTRWESKEVFDGVRLTGFTRTDAEGDEDDFIQIEAEAQFAAYDRIFPIAFGEKAGTEISKEVVPAVYRDDRGDPATKRSTPSPRSIRPRPSWSTARTAGQLHRQIADGDGHRRQSDIALVGDYVIVTSSAGEAYYYQQGQPGEQRLDGSMPGSSPATARAIYAPAVGRHLHRRAGHHKLTIPGRRRGARGRRPDGAEPERPSRRG